MNKNFSFFSIFDILNYTLLAVALTVLQTAFLPRFDIGPALPSLTVGAVCCMGIYRNENYGALFGLVLALFVEAVGSTGISLLPIFYTLVGYVSGKVGENAHENARFSAFLLSVPIVALSNTILSFFYHLLSYGTSIDFKYLLLETLLPELIFTSLLAIPAFLLFKLFDLPLYFARKRGGLI